MNHSPFIIIFVTYYRLLRQTSMEHFNDLFYIQRVKAGDIRAFSPIVAHYQRMVLTVVMKICESREDAEDITQEVFIKAFKNLSQFKEQAGFSTWLYRIAYNTTLSELRKKKVVISSFEDNSLPLSEQDLSDDLDEMEKEERLQCLDKALKLLPPDEAFLITLFYLNNQTMDEISSITSLSISNVKVKLHRIRKKLAIEMNKLMQQ